MPHTTNPAQAGERTPVIPANATHKAIGYAYKTSADAVRFKFAQSGCWVVQHSMGSNPTVSIAGYADYRDAFAHADGIPLPFSRYTF